MIRIDRAAIDRIRRKVFDSGVPDAVYNRELGYLLQVIDGLVAELKQEDGSYLDTSVINAEIEAIAVLVEEEDFEVEYHTPIWHGRVAWVATLQSLAAAIRARKKGGRHEHEI